MLAMDVWCFSKSTIRVDLEKHQTRLHYWGNSLCDFEESPLQLWVFLLCTKHFKFSIEVRKVIYTTNAIESLNSTYRKLNRQRSVFPSDTALLKALYLATFEATKKWTMPIRNWGQVYGELSIMYEGRLPE